MTSAQELRSQLPACHVENTFISWAALRKYAVERDFGCLTTVRLDNEDMRDTVAVEPDDAFFDKLLQAVEEPALRMLAIIAPVDGERDYRAMAKERGAKFVGDGGKIMTCNLAPGTNSATPEEKLAAIDATYIARVQVEDGCCTVEIMAGDKLASTGKATVKDGIATFDGIYTDMDFWRRGLATCVMAFLVRWATTNGASVGLLNASPFGQKLYQGLGWTAIYNVVNVGGESALGFLERMRQKYAPKK